MRGLRWACHMAAAKITFGATKGWKWPLPGRVPLLLGISLSLLVAAAIALTVNSIRLRESSGWVEHTNGGPASNF